MYLISEFSILLFQLFKDPERTPSLSSVSNLKSSLTFSALLCIISLLSFSVTHPSFPITQDVVQWFFHFLSGQSSFLFSLWTDFLFKSCYYMLYFLSCVELYKNIFCHCDILFLIILLALDCMTRVLSIGICRLDRDWIVLSPLSLRKLL